MLSRSNAVRADAIVVREVEHWIRFMVLGTKSMSRFFV